jgi:1-acyl-sn-glycerol-3-phosphate acyltransferase
VPFAFSMIAALRTVLAVFAIALYVLVVAPPLLLWAWLVRRPDVLYVAGRIGVRLGFALVGIRLVVRGRERILKGRAAVYASNHNSNMDPPALYLALATLQPRLRTIYKAEIRRIPLLVWVFDTAGFVPVERARPEQSLPAIDGAARALAAGNSFFVFPEGTRSRTGSLLPFKKGGFVMAVNAQVPIVPVTVFGGQAAMRKGSAVIHPVTVTVDIGAPIETAGLSQSDRDALIIRVKAAIADRLATVESSACD